MKCIECGQGRIQRRLTSIPHEVRGQKFEVKSTALVCGTCRFQMVPSDLIEEHARRVDQAYRSAAGLLTSAQIKAARKNLGMSQAEFAAYLGVGEASVKRWELGSLPDKSSDNLIRLMTDPVFAQGNLEQLCAKLGPRSPTFA